MGRGLGKVQRAAKEVFEQNPAKTFTVTALAKLLCATSVPTEADIIKVRRAADAVAPLVGRARINGGRVRYIPKSQYQPRPTE